MNLNILDTGIGLALVYLGLSLVCSAVNEWLALILSLRGRSLVAGIHALLADPEGMPNLAQGVLEHPLIRSLSGAGRRPAYIAPETFAIVVSELVAPASDSAALQERLAKLPDGNLKILFTTLANSVGNEVSAFRTALEAWFNEGMDRVSGGYKRRAHVINLFVAAVLVLTTNADTVMIANQLYRDPALRAALVAQATEHLQSSQIIASISPTAGDEGTRTDAPAEAWERVRGQMKTAFQRLDTMGLPLGWSGEPGRCAPPERQCDKYDPRDVPRTPRDIFYKGIGLAMTTLAVSLGAPFWFEVLKRMASFRSSGPSPRDRAK